MPDPFGFLFAALSLLALWGVAHILIFAVQVPFAIGGWALRMAARQVARAFTSRAT